MRKRKKKKGLGKNLFRGIGKGLSIALRGMIRLLPVILLSAAAVGLWTGVKRALWADTSFNVQRIEVLPPDALSEATLNRLTASHAGKNLLKIDIRKIAAELQLDPAIASAVVQRKFLSTLYIQVRRRVPAAYIQLSPRGNFGLISQDGMILDVLPKPVSSEVVVEAFGLGFQQPRLGQKIRSQGFQKALEFLDAYRKSPLTEREPITAINIDHLEHVSVVLGAGPAVRLGRQPLEKMQALEKVVAVIEGENRNQIEYVDLQFGDMLIKRKGI